MKKSEKKPDDKKSKCCVQYVVDEIPEQQVKFELDPPMLDTKITSKLEVDPTGDLKRRKVPLLESISGGTHLRVIQTN